jgi:hypothetical protein
MIKTFDGFQGHFEIDERLRLQLGVAADMKNEKMI